MPKPKVCKDCKAAGITTNRPATPPGPRCATHHYAERVSRKSAQHGRYVQKTYAVSPQRYAELLAIQGGRCFICQRAKGKTRRLSVDHDHSCCEGSESCGRCVRGLLCLPCNRDVLGHLRDDVAAVMRAFEYLTNPPAQRVSDQQVRRSGSLGAA